MQNIDIQFIEKTEKNSVSTYIRIIIEEESDNYLLKKDTF